MDTWFDIWFADKQSMLETMLKNMNADLEAGYDYFGKSITKQREDIDTYKTNFDNDMELLKIMEPNKVNHWCYFDLKKRGAIA